MHLRECKAHNHTILIVDVKTKVITPASGSCYIEVNNTKVICGVYGPREASYNKSSAVYTESGTLNVDFNFAPFALPQWREPRQTMEERDISRMIEQALSPSVMLDKFPKSVIDIYIYVIEGDGGEVSAAISCASLALASSGIEMYDLVGCILLVCMCMYVSSM